MVAFIRRDDRTDGAVLYAERPNVHAFAADAHAAITKDAARTIEIYDWRPLLFFFVVLGLHEFRFGGAVGERHVLKFAFAAGVAHRTIQRMVTKQQLDHRLARLTHLIAVRRDDHAFGDYRGAGGLKLGHLFDSYNTHAASALERKPRVVAKRGDFDAYVLAGLDQQRPGGCCDLLSVDS